MRALCLAALLTLASAAGARADCPDNADIGTFLNAANSARSLTEDWEALRELTDWDAAQLVEGYRGGHPEGPRFAAGVQLTFHSWRQGGFALCKDAAPIQTDLTRLWASLAGNFDDTVSGWGGFAQLFLPATGFFQNVPRADGSSGTASVGQVTYSQAMGLGLLRWKGWVELGGGYLGARELSVAQGVARPPGASQAQDSGRPVIAAASPRLHLYSLFVIGDEAAPLEQAWLSLRQFPLGRLPIDVSAELGRLAVEDQVYLALGAGAWGPWWEDLVPRVEVEVTPEFNTPRLRSARVSLSVEVGGSGGREYAPWLPGWLRLGGYLRGSVFNSRYLEEVTGVTGALGWEAGARVQVGVPLAAFVLEGGAARNRPQDLSAFPAGVHHPTWTLTLGLRVSPWAVFGWEHNPKWDEAP